MNEAEQACVDLFASVSQGHLTQDEMRILEAMQSIQPHGCTSLGISSMLIIHHDISFHILGGLTAKGYLTQEPNSLLGFVYSLTRKGQTWR